MLKIVIDANTWTSAMIRGGKPLELIQKFRQKQFQLFYPDWLIVELEKLPYKEKFNPRITHQQVEQFTKLIQQSGTLVNLNFIPFVSRDPKDNAYLACAEVAGCDYLISGDSDLRDLNEYAGIKIVNTAAFLQLLDQRTQ